MNELDYYYSEHFQLYFHDDALHDAYDLYVKDCNKKNIENTLKQLLETTPMLNMEIDVLDNMLMVAVKHGFDIEDNSTLEF